MVKVAYMWTFVFDYIVGDLKNFNGHQTLPLCLYVNCIPWDHSGPSKLLNRV